MPLPIRLYTAIITHTHPYVLLFMNAIFVCSSNGILYGEFSVVDASLSATTVQGTTTRYLNYTITRVEGDSTDTNIFIQHSYSQVNTVYSQTNTATARQTQLQPGKHSYSQTNTATDSYSQVNTAKHSYSQVNTATAR